MYPGNQRFQIFRSSTLLLCPPCHTVHFVFSFRAAAASAPNAATHACAGLPSAPSTPSPAGHDPADPHAPWSQGGPVLGVVVPIPSHRRPAPHSSCSTPLSRTAHARRCCHRPQPPPAHPMPMPASMAHTAPPPATKEAGRHRPPAPGSRHHCLPVQRRCSSYLSEL
jgi:hypothetical protein